MIRQKLYIVAFMLLIAVVFGAAVSGLHLVSQPTVKRNRDLRELKAYAELFGLMDVNRATPEQIATTVGERIDKDLTVSDPESGWQSPLLIAYSDSTRHHITAYGFVFRGLGFWGPIEGMMAVTPDLRETVGLVILAHQETPGLGGRIEESQFRKPFADGILVAMPAPKDRCLVISAMAPKAGDPLAERHVDAIAGATQTSMAMERILNENLARFNRAMRHYATEHKEFPVTWE